MFLTLFNKIFDFLKFNYLWYKTKYFSSIPLYETNYFSTIKNNLVYPKVIVLENEKQSLDISDYIPIFNIHEDTTTDFYFLEKLFNFKIQKINILNSNNKFDVIENSKY